jgi:hypothetical protein
MTLQQKLDSVRQGFEKRAPADALAVMHRVMEDLRGKTPKDVIQEGQPAPGFAAAGVVGGPVNLKGMLAQGPLVLSFIRGHW